MDEHRIVLRPGSRQANEAAWADLQSAVKVLAESAFPNDKAVEIVAKEKKRSRSLAQNRLLWWWYKQIADHINASQGTAFSDEEIHEWLKERFLGSEVIEIDATPVRARKSTTKLNIQQMTEYLENIDWFANERLGLVLPHPEDLYAEAMGRDRRVA